MLPSHSGPFHYPRVKLARARMLIKELQSELVEYAKAVAENPPVYTTWKPTPDDKIPMVPEMVSAIIGDIFHNMRASLDVMACEVVRASGKSDAGVHFPFATKSAEAFGGLIKGHKFDRAGPDAVALLWTFEPYAQGNADLCAIHDFNVMDKHTRIIPHSLGGRFETEVHHDEAGNLAKVVQQYTPEFNFAVSDNRSTPLAGQSLIPTLHRLVELCERVIEAFAALVAQRSREETV